MWLFLQLEKHKKDKKHSHDKERKEDKKESQEDLEKVKQKRIQASIKERELEVQRSRSEQRKEWEEERETLRKMEAKSQFKLLLGDLVSSVVQAICSTWFYTICVADVGTPVNSQLAFNQKDTEERQ